MVQAILADHLPQALVLAFDSRAAGTPRKYSDLPICTDIADCNQSDSEFTAMVARQGMVELQH